MTPPPCPSLLPFIEEQRRANDGTLADVEFRIEGHDVVFYAHRLVLAATSQYFRIMFTRGFAEGVISSTQGPTVVGRCVRDAPPRTLALASHVTLRTMMAANSMITFCFHGPP